MTGLFGITLLIGEERTVNHTIERSRTIETGFRDAADYIQNFQTTQDRLPSKSEFSEWSSRFPEHVDSPRHFDLESRVDHFPEEVIKKFGPAKGGSYLLSYWRGEWTEYYASWANRSTISFDARRYYFLGSNFADVMSMVVLTGIFAILAIKTWPKPQRSAWDLR